MIYNIKKLTRFTFPDDIKLISFDVFDTLLIRKIEPPSAVKQLVSSLVSKLGYLDIDPDKLLALRNSIEEDLRVETQQNGFDDECSLVEVVDRLVKHLGAESSLKNALLELELKTEKSLVSPMPFIREFLLKLRSRYRLVAVSDTYYPGEMVNHLLNHCGYNNVFDMIYCSCDYKFNKGSGNLFRKILEVNDLPAHEVLHIGDNLISDYLVPRTIGMQAVYIHDDWNLLRKAEIHFSPVARQKNGFWKARSFMRAVQSIDGDRNSSVDVLYLWGKHILGPLLAVYIHLMILEIQREGIQRAFFIAREGFILKKIFTEFWRENKR